MTLVSGLVLPPLISSLVTTFCCISNLKKIGQFTFATEHPVIILSRQVSDVGIKVFQSQEEVSTPLFVMRGIRLSLLWFRVICGCTMAAHAGLDRKMLPMFDPCYTVTAMSGSPRVIAFP